MGRIPVARARIAALVVAVAVLAADLGSKAAVRDLVSTNDSVALIPGVLWVTHVGNQGAAFGMMQGLRWFFVGVGVAVLAGVTWFLWRHEVGSRWTALAAGLVAGGAGGNLHDRLLAGRVTDFIDLGWFPVFNLADAAIVVGVAILSYRLLFDGDMGEGELGGPTEGTAP